MIISVKSSPSSQIEFKQILGFKNIEIQLLKEKTNKEDYENTISFNDINILSVHTPICNGLDVDINAITNKRFFNMLHDTCKLAQSYALYYKHEVVVVIHNSWSKREWEIYDDNKKKIVEIFKQIIAEFPNIKFAVENTTPYEKNQLNTGYEMKDVKYIVDYLNNKIPDNKFGIVLDICHLLMTYRAKTLLMDNFTLTKTEFFKEAFRTVNKDLFILHLNNCYYDGRGKDHGTKFDKENQSDLEFLENILTFKEQYTNNPIVCLEIREDDYTNCINLPATFEAVKIVANKLNIDINK